VISVRIFKGFGAAKRAFCRPLFWVHHLPGQRYPSSGWTVGFADNPLLARRVPEESPRGPGRCADRSVRKHGGKASVKGVERSPRNRKANFREPPQDEVRGISLPCTWVNKQEGAQRCDSLQLRSCYRSVGRRPSQQVQQVPEQQRRSHQNDHALYASLRGEAPHSQRPEPGHDPDLRERAG